MLCRDCAQAPPPPPQGLEILAFPCNQFGGQEPKSNAEIKAFAQARGAEYPLFAKVNVNGPNAHPLYKWMKAETLAAFGLIEVPVKWCAKCFVGFFAIRALLRMPRPQRAGRI